MDSMFSRLKVIVPVLILIFVSSIYILSSIWAQSSQKKQSYEPESFKVSSVRGLLQSPGPVLLGRELSKAIHAGRIKPEEFENLDFTFSAEPGFGQNLAYEVFNPESPRTVMTSAEFSLPLIPQALIDDAVTAPRTSPFFALRESLADNEYRTSTLVMVVPNIDLNKCKEPEGWSVPVVELAKPLEFFPSISSADSIPASLYSVCIQGHDNKGFLMFPLVQRYKRSSSDVWKAFHLHFNPQSNP